MTALEKLAKAAVEPYRRFLSRGRIEGDDLKLQAYGEAADPQTILAMIELLQKMAEALEDARGALAYVAVGNEGTNLARSTCSHGVRRVDNALAKYKEMMK